MVMTLDFQSGNSSSILDRDTIYTSVDQLEDRGATNAEVTGSSPVRGANKKAGDDRLKSSDGVISCSLAATSYHGAPNNSHRAI